VWSMGSSCARLANAGLGNDNTYKAYE